MREIALHPDPPTPATLILIGLNIPSENPNIRNPKQIRMFKFPNFQNKSVLEIWSFDNLKIVSNIRYSCFGFI